MNFSDDEQPVLPLTFQPLPLGSITPNGWLASELQTSASGLAGHMHSFYPYVSNTSWLGKGSSEYSPLNEGWPYWLNGLIPLAYSLDDERLKEQVHTDVQGLVDRQAEDGWLGPEVGTARNFWSRIPVMLALTNLVDANVRWEEPVLNAMGRFVELMHDMLKKNYTGFLWHEGDALSERDTQWGRVRVQDMLISLMWMYEKHPRGLEEVLLECMWLFRNASINWADWYNEDVYVRDDLNNVAQSVTEENFAFLHGVNVAQGLKQPAVFRRFTHNDSLIQTASDGVDWTFRYHGAASGTILADEREDGLSPYSGSELCTAVETIYSLTYLHQSLGDPKYAELSEKTTFNALPVMMTGDWWAHQYMAQPNQPYSVNLTDPPFWNTNSLGQTYGLEPNYPCCTVNHPQGLPKFLMATYVTVGDNGLAHALLSPASVKIRLSSGNNVAVDCETTYPFGSVLTYSIVSDRAFDFYVRVPTWIVLSGSSIAVGSAAPASLSPDSHGMHRIRVQGSPTPTKVFYILASNNVLETRANDTIAVHNGALLYALQIGALNKTYPLLDYKQHPISYSAPPQVQDYFITNTSRWSWAINGDTLQVHGPDEASITLPTPIFAVDAPPQYISAQGCLIEWPLLKNGVPGSAPAKVDRKCLGDVQEVKLVPYGSAKLHMAELPTIDLNEI